MKLKEQIKTLQEQLKAATEKITALTDEAAKMKGGNADSYYQISILNKQLAELKTEFDSYRASMEKFTIGLDEIIKK